MNKGFSWNWVVSGLIIGLVVISIFISMLGKLFMENARQDADAQFSEIYSRVDTLCTASVNEEDFYNVKIPDIVEGLYISDTDKSYPDEFEKKVEKSETFVGSYLCMKLEEERQRCKRLKCEIEMSYLGQRKTVISLADRILGRQTYTTYPIYFSKNECGVSVLTDDKEATQPDSGCVPNRCGLNVLMGCNRLPAAVIVDDKALLLADTTPFCNKVGTSMDCFVPDETIEFSLRVADYFKGLNGANDNMLIIWEDEKMNPAGSNFKPLVDNLSSILSTIEFYGHHAANPPLTFGEPSGRDINGYDQVWIFRPGWCEGEEISGVKRDSLAFCDDYVPWSDSEIRAIGDYVEAGGKIFLATDYSSITDDEYKSANNIRQRVNVPQDKAANRIVKAIREDVYFDTSGCYCGCGMKSSTNYATNPIVEDMTFSFSAATRIMC